MAHSFRIEVEGDQRAFKIVGEKANDIPAALRVASEAAARVLEDAIKDVAPEPRSNTEVQGHGISTKVERRFRLAGRAKGGLLRTAQTFTISAVVKDPSVAAFVEWGTGIYAEPERQGPRVEYTIGPGPGRKAVGPFPGPDGGERWARRVTIPGTKPHPFIAIGVESVESEIEAIYEAAVDEVI